MKKVALFVALFLGGMAAQATTYNQKNVGDIPNYKRFKNVQSIEFVSNGVLFKVATNGTFTFDFLYPNRGLRNQNNNNVVYYENAHRRRNNYNRNLHRRVIRDHCGTIKQVSTNRITYNKRGKVKTIGDVRLRYHRGRLINVGGMEITYNRFGEIRNTYGSIFQHNNINWHDDWYTINDDDYFRDDYAVSNNRRDRIRIKK